MKEELKSKPESLRFRRSFHSFAGVLIPAISINYLSLVDRRSLEFPWDILIVALNMIVVVYIVLKLRRLNLITVGDQGIIVYGLVSKTVFSFGEVVSLNRKSSRIIHVLLHDGKKHKIDLYDLTYADRDRVFSVLARHVGNDTE